MAAAATGTGGSPPQPRQPPAPTPPAPAPPAPTPPAPTPPAPAPPAPTPPAPAPTGGGHPTRWLDADERATWLSLLRVMTKLPPLLDARLERGSGLNLFEYTILAMLSEQPGATLRMSRLASVTNASPSRLSHAARHLEDRGYLVRVPDPDDGRCIRAVLTAPGRRLVDASAPGHVADVRELVLEPLTRPQQRALREANERILRRVDPDGSTDPARSET